MKPSAWTPARIERLKILWAERRTASEIARILDCGVSRCAVLAKIDRLGLSRPEAASRQAKIRLQEPLPQTSAGEPDFDTPTAEATGGGPAPLNIGFLELESGHCRYAVNDTMPFLFCGHPAQAGSSYCAWHHALTHVAGSEPTSRERPPPRPRARSPASNMQEIAEGAGRIFGHVDRAA